MECRKEENLKECPCTYKGCERKGLCCECVKYHLENDELPACYFSKEAEKSYDRSISKFIEDIKKKPGVGVGVMILKNNKVLLGKRHSDPEKADSMLHGEGSWTMPGGKLDFGEKLKDAAYREVLEETGISIDKEKLDIISVTDDIVSDAHFITIGFLCKAFAGEPKIMEPDEIVEWKWFDLNNAPTPIFFPSEKILKKFINKEKIN